MALNNIDTDMDCKGNAWVARMQADQRNAANASQASDSMIAVGHALKVHLQNAYVENRIFLNFNKKTLAVKVGNTTPRQRNEAEAYKALHDFMAQHNVTVRAVNSNRIYHIQY